MIPLYAGWIGLTLVALSLDFHDLQEGKKKCPLISHVHTKFLPLHHHLNHENDSLFSLKIFAGCTLKAAATAPPFFKGSTTTKKIETHYFLLPLLLFKLFLQ